MAKVTEESPKARGEAGAEEAPVPLGSGRMDGGAAAAPAEALDQDELEAFGRLLGEVVVASGPRLLRLAASYLPDEADDLLNGAAEKAWRRPHAFRHGDPRQLASWLETTIRRDALKLVSARRRRGATDPRDLDEWPAPGDEAVGLLESTRERVATLEALAELPAEERRCLLLSAQRRSRAEIAELTGATERQVQRRLYRGRRRLLAFGEELEAGERCRLVARELGDYLDHALGSERRARVARHLDHCDACVGHLKALRREGARLSAALPPVLLVPAVDVAADEPSVRLGGQLAQGVDDAWLAAAHGFGARVADGWAALGPVSRLVGAGMATLLALAGVGTIAGERAVEAPAPIVAERMVSASRAPSEPAQPTRTREQRREARHAKDTAPHKSDQLKVRRFPWPQAKGRPAEPKRTGRRRAAAPAPPPPSVPRGVEDARTSSSVPRYQASASSPPPVTRVPPAQAPSGSPTIRTAADQAALEFGP